MICFQVAINSSKLVPMDAEWTYGGPPSSGPLDYFELNELQPATGYQLMMRVGNKLGWSNYSSSNFVFHTLEGD